MTAVASWGPDGLEVCDDCAMLIANGDGTQELVELQAARWGRDLPGLVLACDPEDDSPCPTFSTRRCDGCGSMLAGGRHAAALLRQVL